MTVFPSLQIGSYIARYPIIQGGMGVRISCASLASAVANAGGIGTISASGLGINSPYFDADEPNPKKRHQQFLTASRLALIDELNTARRLSPTGIIGVNIMVAAREYQLLVRAAVENGANVIVAGAGLPLQLPAYTQDHPEVALVPIVSSVRAAKLICRKWQRQQGRLPDAFIVEDPQVAGGHLGATEDTLNDPEWAATAVIPALVAYLKDEFETPMPVIAAGGIWDQRDIVRALALGADGVQIGTRFITTHECDADLRYKEFHLNASPDDVRLVPSPVGLPGRALLNPFAEKIMAGTPNPRGKCLANCLKSCKFRDKRETYCIIRALDRASRGDIENGLIFAGTNAGRATRMMSVAEIMQELMTPAPVQLT
ncbi:nitronate monooxygenase [Leptolyngbyaceae cyanobacterium CCMR0082]|uniref:Nitronate monooxygenase n=2 Tax=Adonisia turfae TaxID=2950184 RepID=A0A6M0S0F9_9CYAN|nr:nitronate monooxygenase family protein [Adonisia turfae]MDV3349271.1 nitronate monooxygenase family protein [Leptothoe sp. LEGE 181152]NEZ59372.1 nitronate monooxygenase [Adonisia turfae CCMR0081]NEZ61431.1 nitronate monooxygenase [Adonisia turfae CCMR0082]